MNRENERLKNKILDLAIRGKLVPQDINDEPASVLLEKIKQERKKLIAEKKIKQENYSEIYKNPTDNHYYEKFEDGTINDITEEIPFEIPNTWCWVKINNISEIYTGNSIPEEVKNSKYSNLNCGYNYIGTKDISFESTINYNNGIKIPFDEVKFKKAYKNNTLLCIEGGSAGKKIGYLDEDVCFGNKLATFNSWCINPKYLYYVLHSSILRLFFDKNLTGIIGGVSINVLKKLIIPLPPIKEQEKIVFKINNSFDYLFKKENNENKILELKTLLKSKILDLAIHGNLVKQDKDNEPAELLINKILDEKRALIKSKEIKKENLSIIYKDSDNQFYEKFDDGKIINITEEIPFDIPKNWRWSRLSTICTKIVDGDHNPPQGQNIQTEYIMLSAKNIQNNQLVNFSDARFLSKEDYDKGKQRISLKEGDILLTIVGTLGRSCIYNDIEKNILFQRSVSVISTLINNNYLKFVFDSSYMQNKMQKESTGTAQRGFYLNQLSNVLIPVPPIIEETLIINKLNKILKTAE